MSFSFDFYSAHSPSFLRPYFGSGLFFMIFNSYSLLQASLHLVPTFLAFFFTVDTLCYLDRA